MGWPPWGRNPGVREWGDGTLDGLDGSWDIGIPLTFECPHCKGLITGHGRKGEIVTCPYCKKTFEYGYWEK